MNRIRDLQIGEGLRMFSVQAAHHSVPLNGIRTRDAVDCVDSEFDGVRSLFAPYVFHIVPR
jgi:hypothetical protein